MFSRDLVRSNIGKALARSRAVALVGPRQIGKTTLAREWLHPDSPNYFDLELPSALARLQEPEQALGQLQGLVVIDEVQLRPHLFPLLRSLMDREQRAGQYLLLGSASPAMLRQAGESLLGRIEVIEVAGFNLGETGVSAKAMQRLWLRGGYPLSYIADQEEASWAWRQQALMRYVEQDLRQLGIDIAPAAMLRFWRMLAHYHAQVWNAAPFAQSLGISQPTVRKYLDILTSTYMVRQLQPWHENLGKRQVKAPKIYLRDSGLLHSLMGIRHGHDLMAHPMLGASWEGFALEQVLQMARPDEAYFWATHQGAELDLLMLHRGQRIGVEFKRSETPGLTKSMRIALSELKLDKLYVVYPGLHRFPVSERVEAVPLSALLTG